MSSGETSLDILLSESHMIYQINHLEATYDQSTEHT
jgi:hypothetical protein